MTSNQIAFVNSQIAKDSLVETKRHNLSQETETQRSNIARESETAKHNRVAEDVAMREHASQAIYRDRSGRAALTQAAASVRNAAAAEIAANARMRAADASVAAVGESQRHNQVLEQLQAKANDVARIQQNRSLSEAERHNRALEQLRQVEVQANSAYREGQISRMEYQNVLDVIKATREGVGVIGDVIDIIK